MWAATFTTGNRIQFVNAITLFNSTNFCSTYFLEHAATEDHGEVSHIRAHELTLYV